MLNDSRRSESRRGRFLKRLWLFLIFTVLAAGGFLGWTKFEPWRPEIRLAAPLEFVGRQTEIMLAVTDRGTGLAAFEVALDAGGKRFALFSETYPTINWRGSGIREKSFKIPLDAREAKIPEGAAMLVVAAHDASWLNFFLDRPAVLSQPLQVDTTPPTVEALTSQHYMRLGGADLVVYKTSKDAVQSAVEVERYTFPGVKGLFPDPDVSVALFAVPQDLTPKARPRIVATDAAGNRREADFWVSIKPRNFPERTLDVGDDFLKRKVPDLLDLNHLPPTDDLVAGYLEINRNLRKASEEIIRKVCSRSEPRRLWTESFMRQPDSAPLSSFADRRTYKHDGQIIDSQTHLGFDLASLRLAEVTAGNDGKVVFADNLGIYGNTVILDHGLGLFSLYGHLSSISAQVGQLLHRGEVLGRTGETGLAAGDHLHFSIMVDGIHVDPVEWWDPKWVADHVVEKMKAFESPATASSETALRTAAPAPAPKAPPRRRRRR